MSAFIVSDAHISALVTYGMREGLLGMSAQAAGAMLYRANAESVNARYPEDDNPTDGYVFIPDTKIRLGVEIAKACICLAYQSNETDTWEKSDAYRLVHRIRTYALRLYDAKYQSSPRDTPGYDEASWTIDS